MIADRKKTDSLADFVLRYMYIFSKMIMNLYLSSLSICPSIYLPVCLLSSLPLSLCELITRS